MEKTIEIHPIDNRKSYLLKQLEDACPKYNNMQENIFSLLKKTLNRNIEDIAKNIINCETSSLDGSFKYFDSETNVYMLVSIFNKTKEQVYENYDCISTSPDLAYFNFYNRHFLQSWPPYPFKYLVHLVVCNERINNLQARKTANQYSCEPIAPGEFVVFMIDSLPGNNSLNSKTLKKLEIMNWNYQN